MLCTLTLLFVAAMPQAPGAAEAEARARADIGQAGQHLDKLQQVMKEARALANVARELARATEATANLVDRARLAKLAADVTVELTTLEAAIEQHSTKLKELRLAIQAEAPAAPPGSVAQFRERMLAARKLPTHAETMTALRSVEADLQTEGNRAKEGAAPLLGLARFLLATAIREEAATQRGKRNDAKAIDLMRDASKKLEEVLKSPDSEDSGEGSSLHAVALLQRIEVESSLYLAFHEQARRQPSSASTAKQHRANAEDAFTRLKKAYPEATLPNGLLVVDATRAAVDQLRGLTGR